jgi:hypothetical protein
MEVPLPNGKFGEKAVGDSDAMSQKTYHTS